MHVSTATLTRAARDQGYAVPAVNVFDEVSMRAVVEAADAAAAPMIVQVSVKTVRTVGTALLTATFEAVTRDSKVPVALHLDHCPDRSVIDEVVAAGWSSVLFDASDRDLEDAVRETTEVVAQAHAAGVDVESEIENILGVEDGVGSDVAVHAYSVEQLAEVADRTGADLLAPQLGTSHGAYKFSRKPTGDILAISRVKEIHARIPNTHLVMHGSSSVPQEWLAIINEFGGDLGETYGVPVEEIVEGIKHGVRKVNIDTDLRLASTGAIRRFLAQNPKEFDPRKYLKVSTDAMRDICIARYEAFGACGQAAKIKPVSLDAMANLYLKGQLAQIVK